MSDWWNNPKVGDVEKAERLLDEMLEGREQMSTQRKISRKVAEEVLAWCRERWDPANDYGMFLKPGEDEELSPGSWVICMEGQHGWTIETAPKVSAAFGDVYAEPYTGWGLALYPPTNW